MDKPRRNIGILKVDQQKNDNTTMKENITKSKWPPSVSQPLGPRKEHIFLLTFRGPILPYTSHDFRAIASCGSAKMLKGVASQK